MASESPGAFDHGVSYKLFTPDVPDGDDGPDVAAPQRPVSLSAGGLRVRDPAAI